MVKEATRAVTVDAGQFAGFGPNEWLVYEMYQGYLNDPESVDKAWWDFFADYSKGAPSNGNGVPSAPTWCGCWAERSLWRSHPS